MDSVSFIRRRRTVLPGLRPSGGGGGGGDEKDVVSVAMYVHDGPEDDENENNGGCGLGRERRDGGEVGGGIVPWSG
jgi:hypothetical protein